jgi:C4-dicarboxylate-specific signal transduction histidine kinase
VEEPSRDAEPHLRILHVVAETVSRSLDVDEVLRTALDALTHVTGHEIASLHLLSADGTTLELRADRGLSPALREANRVLPVGRGVIGTVAATGQTVHVPDMLEHYALLESARAAVQASGIHGFVCVPIHCRDRLLGTLSLGRQAVTRFTDRDIALLEATANQIGLALDNARLYSESQRRFAELQRTHTQLIQAEKLSAVGQLAAGVAHEVNQPLTVILGHAEVMLLAGEIADDERRRRLQIIVDQTKRAAKIVRNLLLFARQYTPERRRLSLEGEVRHVLELKAYQLERDDVRVVTEFEPCPPVSADANQIQQVLLNLIQNAHQAMVGTAGDRVLTVRVAPSADMVAVEVLDSGPGIPDTVLPHIFEPFFTTKRPGEGTGLGLSVSYGIIAEHGGRLTAANRAGGGAAFLLELPAEPVADQPSA